MRSMLSNRNLDCPLPLAVLWAAWMACLIVLSCGLTVAQSIDKASSFDVASVKPSTVDSGSILRGGPGTSSPGQITYQRVPFIMIFRIAYPVERYQIIGPEWMGTQEFDIVAKMAQGTTRDQFRAMLQNLLAERFQLTFHHELRDSDVFELLTGRNGPKMSETEPDSPEEEASSGWTVLGIPKVPMIQMLRGYVVRITGVKQPIRGLATILGNQVHRPVLDRTGLKGSYSFTLEFTVERPDTPVGAAVPDVFSAVEEQLGLRLKPHRTPMDVLVIDHLDKSPTAN